MSPAETINTASGALVAGLAASLHCAGMCGPLACSLLTLKGNAVNPQEQAALYHAGRILAYTSLGAAGGALGRWPLEKVSGSPLMVLPWVLSGVLLFMAFGFSVKLPRPASFRKWTARTRLRLARIPARRGAFALGVATPLLPCGPLYLMLGISLASGSALRGAEFMLAFALGTVPLLWVAQHRFHVWRQRLGASGLLWTRRIVCVSGAAMLLLRIWPHSPPASDSAAHSLKSAGPVPPPACPFCAADSP